MLQNILNTADTVRNYRTGHPGRAAEPTRGIFALLPLSDDDVHNLCAYLMKERAHAHTQHSWDRRLPPPRRRRIDQRQSESRAVPQRDEAQGRNMWSARATEQRINWRRCTKRGRPVNCAAIYRTDREIESSRFSFVKAVGPTSTIVSDGTGYFYVRKVCARTGR